MRPAILILWLAATTFAQTRVGQCGASSSATASTNAAPAKSTSVAAKPGGSRSTTPPALPQIRYNRIPPAPLASCVCGTVVFTALTSPDTVQEIPLIGGVSGRYRFDHILLQEEKRFASDLVDRLTVSVGRPGTDGEMISSFALKSDAAPQNFVFQIPNPLSLTGAYDLVLKFAGSSPLATGGATNFSAGSLNWEVCGGQV